MKKNLLITTLFFITTVAVAMAQCTPDPIYVTAGAPGLFPTPTEGIATGIEGNAYTQNFTVIVPADTTVAIPPAPATTLTVNTVTVTGITGLPTGLSYTCDPVSCVWNGGTNGCFEVTGTPTQSGTFTMSVSVVVNVEVPVFGPTDAPAQNIDYTLTIDTAGTVSVQQANATSFEVYPITPNPSSNGAEIRFTSPDYRDVSLTVHNMIGAQVIAKRIYSEQGVNIVPLNANELRPGIYIVTLTDGEQTSTKRMVVSR